MAVLDAVVVGGGPAGGAGARGTGRGRGGRGALRSSRAVVAAVVVGGGPAGSACARVLVRGGARVAVVDRATFPRVKLCAGWVSAPIWDVLELAPAAYPGG